MWSGALLGLIAWQVMLADCVPTMQQYYDEMPRSLSNIELLIPLVMSDADDASDESDPRVAGDRHERARLDIDMPFSDIPSSAFVLDQRLPSSSHKHKRGHKLSRKQDLRSLPRSAYLESDDSDESEERGEPSELGELARDVWRACYSLVRAHAWYQHEVLRALCSELLDAAPAPPGLWLKPDMRARREFVGLGDNSYWVQNYMKAPRKRPHRPDPNEE